MLDFLMSNSGLLMGGTGGGIALYILKKVPNKEICGWAVLNRIWSWRRSCLQQCKLVARAHTGG